MNLYITEKNEQRKWDAQHLKKVDRVPVCFSDQLDFLHGWLGFDCQRYHFDPQVTLDAQIAFNKRFDGTGIIGPNWGVAIEPSAFGSKVIFPKDNPPWALEVCKDLDDLEDFVNNLEDPNPVSSGYIPAFLESYFYMQRVTDGQIGKAPGCSRPSIRRRCS